MKIDCIAYCGRPAVNWVTLLGGNFTTAGRPEALCAIHTGARKRKFGAASAYLVIRPYNEDIEKNQPDSWAKYSAARDRFAEAIVKEYEPRAAEWAKQQEIIRAEREARLAAERLKIAEEEENRNRESGRRMFISEMAEGFGFDSLHVEETDRHFWYVTNASGQPLRPSVVVVARESEHHPYTVSFEARGMGYTMGDKQVVMDAEWSQSAPPTGYSEMMAYAFQEAVEWARRQNAKVLIEMHRSGRLVA